MKFKDVAIGMLVFVLMLGLGWAVMGNNFFLYKFFAPKFEATRRETFEESKAYRQGATQELDNMRFEYVKADTPHQAALRSVILHRAADIDENILSPDLKQFIQQLRSEKSGGKY